MQSINIRGRRTTKSLESALWMVEKLKQGNTVALYSLKYPKDMIQKIRKLGINPTITHGDKEEGTYTFKLK